jgi:hypothetical protein
MFPRLALCSSFLFLLACSGERPALSQAEQDALAYIERTPYLEVRWLERLGDDQLLITTQQGEQQVRYRIDGQRQVERPEQRVSRVPDRGLRYNYNHSKPRGGWQTDLRH